MNGKYLNNSRRVTWCGLTWMWSKFVCHIWAIVLYGYCSLLCTRSLAKTSSALDKVLLILSLWAIGCSTLSLATKLALREFSGGVMARKVSPQGMKKLLDRAMDIEANLAKEGAVICESCQHAKERLIKRMEAMKRLDAQQSDVQSAGSPVG